jgi:hypothetical protein
MSSGKAETCEICPSTCFEASVFSTECVTNDGWNSWTVFNQLNLYRPPQYSLPLKCRIHITFKNSLTVTSTWRITVFYRSNAASKCHVYVSICNKYRCVYFVDGVTGNSHYRSDGSTSKLFHLVSKQNVVHSVMEHCAMRNGVKE